MTTEHPITPPPELVQQWVTNAHDIGAPPGTCPNTRKIIVPAINWGWQQRGAVNEAELQKARDEELEACCEWASQFNYDDYRYQDELHALRRPKLSSLKEQALEALKHAEEGWRPIPEDCALIRRALESLPD